MRPHYRDLRAETAGIEHCAWELWGPDDELGAFNDVDDEIVMAAVSSVRRGAVFSLNWSLDLPDPGLFERGMIAQHVKDDGFGMDEYWDGFVPQCSSQWDSLAHFSHPEHGYYGGHDSAYLRRPDPHNGIEHLARRGVVTRFVLADVARWRAAQGRPLSPGTADPVTATDLRGTLEAAGEELRLGDVLIIRFGWVEWYQQLDEAARVKLAEEPWDMACAGLQPDEEVLEFLWDAGVCGAVGDNPSLEMAPFDPTGVNLHSRLLALLGIPIGEMWDLEALAADCAADGRYHGLLTSAPLNYPGGLGSPANALALK